MAEGGERDPLLPEDGNNGDDGNDEEEGHDNEGFENRGNWWDNNNSLVPHRRQQETTSDPQHTYLEMEERSQLQEDARKIIQKTYPDWDPKKSPFVATMTKGKVTVSLIDGKKITSTKYVLFKEDGEIRGGLPKKIILGLGRSFDKIAEDEYVYAIENIMEENNETINELTKDLSGLRGTISKLEDKLGMEYQQRKEEKLELEGKVKESEEKISTLESEKKRMKKENDEALRRAREDYEKRIEHAVTLKMEEVGASKEDNENQVRKINKKYEEEMSKKKEEISDLENRLDISNKEKKELIAATREDLERLNKRKNEELRQVEEDYEARVEKLKEDNTTLGNERDKFFEDKTNDLKRNYEEHIREITTGFEERMREKDKQISNLSMNLRKARMSLDDLNEELTETRKKTLTVDERKILEESEMKIEENEERIDELMQEREAVEERLTLRERVKLIFKKHGFTVVAVLSAVGAVIGVLLSNLKSGLAKVAKGVGNGLKELGKKLAGILPGMIGAIAKFLFDTAGEVIGFLAEHAWLLIVGLVIFVVESFKRKFAKDKK